MYDAIFVHQRGVACLTRWSLLDQVVATHSPPVTRVAIEVGSFALVGTASPVDGESYAFGDAERLADAIDHGLAGRRPLVVGR